MGYIGLVLFLEAVLETGIQSRVSPFKESMYEEQSM